MAKKRKSKRASKRKPRPGSVLLDTHKIDAELERRGLAWTTEKEGCLVSRATWQRIKDGERVSRGKALQVAAFLRLDVLELVREDGQKEKAQEWPEHPEWEIVDQEIPWEHTSNGLYFYRCKVRHKHVGDEMAPIFGQARVYDLSRVPDKRRQEMRELLTRHAMVCRRLAPYPQFITNHTVAPVASEEKMWLVVDEWVEGETLTEVMAGGRIGPKRLSEIMCQIAEGLGVLHKNEVVVRELSPRRLLLDEDGRVRFIELDLAKVLFRDKTVSTDWADDDIYRAPEVEDGTATPQADFFSWGMIFLHAAAGSNKLTWRDVDSAAVLTEPVRKLLKRCLSPSAGNRPRSAQQLLKALG